MHPHVVQPPPSTGSLTCDHQGEVETLLHRFPVDLVWQSGKAHVLLLMVLQGRGGGKQVRVCHPSCLPLTQQQGVGFHKPLRQRQGLKERSAPALAALGARACTSSMAKVFCPSRRWPRGPSSPSHSPAWLLSPAYTTVYSSLPARKARGKRHIPLFPSETTSGAAADRQSSELFASPAQSQAPFTAGHQTSSLPRSFTVTSTSLPPERQCLMESSL